MRSAWLGRVDYETATALQEQFVYGKLENSKHGCPEPEDTLLLLEHPPLYSYHTERDFETCLREKKQDFWRSVRTEKIAVVRTSRGGKMTYHGPGQLVGYMIKRLDGPFARDFVATLARGIMTALMDYGIPSHYRDGGVWSECIDGVERKICSFGVRFVHGRITMHGFALNITAEPLRNMERIYPCGAENDRGVTSLSEHMGVDLPLEEVANDVARACGAAFHEPVRIATSHEFGFYPIGKPPWVRKTTTRESALADTRTLVKNAKLHTVCEEAKCPNLTECWSRGDATIMILGDTCTRSCGFCSVKTGRPNAVDQGEPKRTALAVAQIPHTHIVITSVDRDELPDNGSLIWRATIEQIRKRAPDKTIEVLTPDFKGNDGQIRFVLDAEPDVFAHNIETVARLHSKVRPQAKYDRSLRVLSVARAHWLKPVVKSNIMLGFGESEGEVLDTVRDLRDAGVSILTITQYLQPTPCHLPVVKYYSPDEFAQLKQKAEAIGIPVVVAGPLVRTSYRAGEAYKLIKQHLAVRMEGTTDLLHRYASR